MSLVIDPCTVEIINPFACAFLLAMLTCTVYSIMSGIKVMAQKILTTFER